jgi:xanthine dehydrogenase YagT iron-sulfur-binding subunit
MTLLDALRSEMGVSSPKKGCDQGQCGACTVLLNGRWVVSCLTLAVAVDGDAVTTVEGIGRQPGGHELQDSFVRLDGLQCGFCTPGQLCSAVGLLAEHQAGWPSAVTPQKYPGSTAPLDAAEIRERLSGNLCRCGAHPSIVQAVLDVAREGHTQ